MRLEYRFDERDHWIGPISVWPLNKAVATLLGQGPTSIRLTYEDGSWVEYRECNLLPTTSEDEARLVHSVATSLERRG